MVAKHRSRFDLFMSVGPATVSSLGGAGVRLGRVGSCCGCRDAVRLVSCQPFYDELTHATGRQGDSFHAGDRGRQHARVHLLRACYPPWASRGLRRLKPEDIR